MGATELILFLVIGAIAGWLAGELWKGHGFGLLGNIVVGIVGAFLGGSFPGRLSARQDRRHSRWRHPRLDPHGDDRRAGTSADHRVDQTDLKNGGGDGERRPLRASGLAFRGYRADRRRFGLGRGGSGGFARRFRPRPQAELTQTVRVEGVVPLQDAHEPAVLGDAFHFKLLAAMGRLRKLGLKLLFARFDLPHFGDANGQPIRRFGEEGEFFSVLFETREQIAAGE
jgi:uncharacterized membrane protein YeaQ/YmgE (transglycosylase-associated protein family)